MKTFVKIFLVVAVLMALASAVFAAPVAIKKDPTESVTVTSTHFKDLLILKADKKFMGAVVEVHDATGAVVATSQLLKKKMIIDFYDIPYGSYTIHVLKDKEKLEFSYTKIQGSEILN